MKRKRVSKSIRKYVRKEKARIRCLGLDSNERNKLIGEIRSKFAKQNDNK